MGLLEFLPEAFQPGWVLPDEQLYWEVQGVEGPGEGSKLRLVYLQAHHLAHPNLHSVQPHRPVLLQVRQHEEQGQVGWRFGSWHRRRLHAVCGLRRGRFFFNRPLGPRSCDSLK